MVRLDSRNSVSARNIYPGMGGATTGQRASAGTPYSGIPSEGSADVAGAVIGASASTPGSSSAAAGFVGKPFSWWFILLGLLVALMYAAQKFGSQAEEFRTIKLSIYNVLVIALSAIVGIGFLKVVFARWQVPGLSTFVLAV